MCTIECIVGMAGNESCCRWIFTQKQLEDTPSRRTNIHSNQELSERKTGTSLIQCVGQLLKLRQICLNTAFIYFHRFYMFRSFAQYSAKEIGVCSLFLASKYNENPIPLDSVIRVYYSVINDTKRRLNRDDEEYKSLCDKLIANENEMLLIFGFNLSVTHSHALIVSAGHKLSLKEEITQSAYYIATELIKSTTMCLQYEPRMIACIAIYLSNKLSNLASNDTLDWCRQIDVDIKPKLVKEIANKHQTCLTTMHLDFIRNKQRKRTLSGVCNSSPESAYSSGSNNSPVYEQSNNNCLSSPLPDNSSKQINSNTLSNKRFCSLKNNGNVKQLAVNSTNQSVTNKSSTSVTHNLNLSTEKCIKREKAIDCEAHSSVKSSSILTNSSEKNNINLNSVKKEKTGDYSSPDFSSIIPHSHDPRLERKKNLDCVQNEISSKSVTNSAKISIIPQNDLRIKKELKKPDMSLNVRKPIIYKKCNTVSNTMSTITTNTMSAEVKSKDISCVVTGLTETTKTLSATINNAKFNKKQFHIPKNFMITVKCNSISNKDNSSVRTVRECGANE